MAALSAAQQDRFMRELFGREWPSAHHVAALRAYFMREHVEDNHPEQVEQVAKQMSEAFAVDAEREAWLYGYRWRDTPEAQEAS